MPIKNPQVIGALPEAPNPADRSTFNTRAYPWSAALIPWTNEVNQIAQDTFENAQAATDEAVAADASSLLAKNWAVSGVEIEAGLYSSKSYALDSAQSASESNADALLALGYKNEAHDSKVAAGTSEINADTYRGQAQVSRNEAAGFAAAAEQSAIEAADVVLGQVFDDTQESPIKGWTSSKIVAWFSGLSTAFSRTLLSRSNAADMRTDLEVMSAKDVTDAVSGVQLDIAVKFSDAMTITRTGEQITKITEDGADTDITYNSDNTVNTLTFMRGEKTRTETYTYADGLVIGMTASEV